MARIGTSALIRLLDRVGTATRAGVDARSIWDKEAVRGSTAHRAKCSLVSEQLNAGVTLGKAMQSTDGYFPSLVCDLIEIGDKTGRLDVVMAGLAEHYRHMTSMKRLFLVGIAWPAIQLGAAIFIVGLLIWVMGIIGKMPNGEPIDILGFGLIGTRGLLIYMAIVSSVLGACVILGLALVRGQLGAEPMRLALRLPVIGGCLKASALSRLAWTLSIALDSGLDARRAVRLSIRSTQNAYYTSQSDVVETAVAEGREFHEGMREAGVFPEEFVDSLEMAELSGTQVDSLDQLAVDYRQRAQASSKVLTLAATFAVWGGTAVILIALIFRLAMFYIGILNDAASGF